MNGKPWLISWRDDPFRTPVVLCFPQAGAGCGQFRPWQKRVGDGYTVAGVQLPGREHRFVEPAATSISDVVGSISDAIVSAVPADVPLLFFGYSFGGLLAYEVTRELTRRRDQGGDRPDRPDVLVVAACRPPHMWVVAGKQAIDGDDESLEQLLADSGLVAADLDEDSYALALDLLRKDAELSASYDAEDQPPVACPLAVWGGEGDRTVTSEQLRGWHEYAGSRLSTRTFAGGHAFPMVPASDVPSALAALLDAEQRAELGRDLDQQPSPTAGE